jgi:hypothetical protein
LGVGIETDDCRMFTMAEKRREMLCNVEVYRDGTAEAIRFIPPNQNGSVLKYECECLLEDGAGAD